MSSINDIMVDITPQVLLKAYACGIFPMAESAEDSALYWIEPERRGVLPTQPVPTARYFVRQASRHTRPQSVLKPPARRPIRRRRVP